MITGIQETMMISDDQPTDLSVCGSTSSALLGRYPAITPPTTPELNCEKTENPETGLKGSAALPVENRTESNVNAAKIEELDSITMPKVNSHGKITTYKCKQCDYIATTKVDFWQHSKEKHYRPEKTFYCKFCPFATELKHHFEYHMNGHTGTKPYKCDKCEYSCVNKSMLNSHMKSHSQIYQYRCKDCLYVSKYCHSLKNHLRKYSHRPSAVLNLDGTENHHQIIDVYGTRRGPRQKQRSINQNQQPNPLPEIPSPNVPLFPLLNPFMFNEMLMQMAWQMQQRALLAQNFPSAPSSIHSNENTSSDDEEGNEAISEGENSCDPIVNNDDLKCNICEIAFSNKTMYDIHMTNHNPENPLKCRRCPTVCENGLEFFRHLHEKH